MTDAHLPPDDTPVRPPEADSDDDATIIKHLSPDLSSADLTNGLTVGTTHYDEKKTRELAGL